MVWLPDDMIHKRDRTYTQTDRHRMTAEAALVFFASRGKNERIVHNYILKLYAKFEKDWIKNIVFATRCDA